MDQSEDIVTPLSPIVLNDEVEKITTNPVNDKPMTYDEKSLLSQVINQLPGERLEKVVEIVELNESELKYLSPNELEVDFETLKTITLRELQRYVIMLIDNQEI